MAYGWYYGYDVLESIGYYVGHIFELAEVNPLFMFIFWVMIFGILGYGMKNFFESKFGRNEAFVKFSKVFIGLAVFAASVCLTLKKVPPFSTVGSFGFLFFLAILTIYFYQIFSKFIKSRPGVPEGLAKLADRGVALMTTGIIIGLIASAIHNDPILYISIVIIVLSFFIIVPSFLKAFGWTTSAIIFWILGAISMPFWGEATIGTMGIISFAIAIVFTVIVVIKYVPKGAKGIVGEFKKELYEEEKEVVEELTNWKKIEKDFEELKKDIERHEEIISKQELEYEDALNEYVTRIMVIIRKLVKKIAKIKNIQGIRKIRERKEFIKTWKKEIEEIKKDLTEATKILIDAEREIFKGCVIGIIKVYKKSSEKEIKKIENAFTSLLKNSLYLEEIVRSLDRSLVKLISAIKKFTSELERKKYVMGEKEKIIISELNAIINYLEKIKGEIEAEVKLDKQDIIKLSNTIKDLTRKIELAHYMEKSTINFEKKLHEKFERDIKNRINAINHTYSPIKILKIFIGIVKEFEYILLEEIDIVEKEVIQEAKNSINELKEFLETSEEFLKVYNAVGRIDIIKEKYFDEIVSNLKKTKKLIKKYNSSSEVISFLETLKGEFEEGTKVDEKTLRSIKRMMRDLKKIDSIIKTILEKIGKSSNALIDSLEKIKNEVRKSSAYIIASLKNEFKKEGL